MLLESGQPSLGRGSAIDDDSAGTKWPKAQVAETTWRRGPSRWTGRRRLWLRGLQPKCLARWSQSTVLVDTDLPRRRHRWQSLSPANQTNGEDLGLSSPPALGQRQCGRGCSRRSTRRRKATSYPKLRETKNWGEISTGLALLVPPVAHRGRRACSVWIRRPYWPSGWKLRRRSVFCCSRQWQ